MKTGSGSHNYKLLKRGGGSFAKFSMETGLLLFKYFLVMVDYFVSESLINVVYKSHNLF